MCYNGARIDQGVEMEKYEQPTKRFLLKAIVAQTAILALTSHLVNAETLGTGNPVYQKGGGRTIMINGQMFSRDVVFRVLPVVLPLASIRVTSLYGMRRNPFNGSGVEFHPGVDFGANPGEPVFSSAAGYVSEVGWNGDYGEMIEVKHGLNFKTRYGHLSRYAVKTGDLVDRNTVLGEVGNTGRSTGPHLYWEIWHGQDRVDPVNFVLKAYELYRNLEK